MKTPHMQAEIVIAFVRQSTKTDKNGLTHERRSRKDLLQNTLSNSDLPNMWKVIQGLNVTPNGKLLNEAMSHNGCTIINIKTQIYHFCQALYQVQQAQHVKS